MRIDHTRKGTTIRLLKHEQRIFADVQRLCEVIANNAEQLSDVEFLAEQIQDNVVQLLTALSPVPVTADGEPAREA